MLTSFPSAPTNGSSRTRLPQRSQCAASLPTSIIPQVTGIGKRVTRRVLDTATNAQRDRTTPYMGLLARYYCIVLGSELGLISVLIRSELDKNSGIYVMRWICRFQARCIGCFACGCHQSISLLFAHLESLCAGRVEGRRHLVGRRNPGREAERGSK